LDKNPGKYRQYKKEKWVWGRVDEILNAS